jgi:hypothetical protein
MNKGQQILYEDRHVKITNTYIQIRRYYFPLATSKTIMRREIKNIWVEDGTGINHKWGICRKYTNYWFHLDVDRKQKPMFMCIQLKNSSPICAITPNDLYKAFNALTSSSVLSITFN